MRRAISAFLLAMTMSLTASAGYGTGTVGQVLVGRLGTQVYVELLNANYVSWPCGTPHPNGFHYVFLLNQPGGKEMLAAVLSAQASGKQLQIVGSGTCTQDATVEDVSYVIVQAQ